MAARGVNWSRVVADGGRDRDRSGGAPSVTPATGADPRRCGCAGKTPLDRVVLPARDRVAAALDGTSVRLGPDTDAAILRGSAGVDPVDREVDTVALGEEQPAAPFAGDGGGAPVVTLACVFVGDDLADPDALGDALATAYAGLDGPDVTIGKGHAVQIPDLDGGVLWLEHLRRGDSENDCDRDGATDSDRDGGEANAGRAGGASGTASAGFVAANVDAVHAFPDLTPPEQARIAALNACNDVYAVGATADRVVRPVVASPAGVDPPASQATDWYRAGIPAEVSVLPASVLGHGGESWLLGASVTARGGVDPTEPPLPDDCGVLLTRPLGGLAAFALGHIDGDRGLRELGRDRLTGDARPVAEALAACRPEPDEPFDPARHLARVTDVSGEGIGGVGRLVARDGRSLRLDRLPFLPGVADAAAGGWTIPDATVETNGPFAAIGTPSALARASERLRSVEGADPVRIGTLDRGDAPIRDATGGDPVQFVEAAARWPAAGEER
ncbi:hypothetical protein [Halobaculum magnesiiphilum]|uniref:Selenophosphate synthase n=1 Tax=Halobaculum magnesiiphilum TaxID=1017351 RepID=A0A8T8WIS7_9EURY|nr:hypothetical protein [Halobaculum magnesiiphilum]QZP39730.1 hypothetical protein K6T50_17280 [Halobaculum magnesiiphilum]